tara:strand:+ start:680 stop:811 length:132 start_codon:yes stop_codon:yes gene_type:complete
MPYKLVKGFQGVNILVDFYYLSTNMIVPMMHQVHSRTIAVLMM